MELTDVGKKYLRKYRFDAEEIQQAGNKLLIKIIK